MRRPFSASACSISRTRPSSGGPRRSAKAPSSPTPSPPAPDHARRPQLRVDAAPRGGLRALQDQRAPVPPRGRRRLPHVGEGRRHQLPRDGRHRRPPASSSAPRPAHRPRLHQRRAEAGHGRKAGKKVIGRSLICLNPKQPWKIGFDGRLGVYDLRYTIAHEIGHAIGLDHPSAAGQLMSYRYDEKQTGSAAGRHQGRRAALWPARRHPPLRHGLAAPDGGETPADATRGWPFGIGDGRVAHRPKAVDPR